MLTAGDLIELAIERPAAGGRMIARHEGQIVLVSGGIPGERVKARVEQVERRVAFAIVVDVRSRLLQTVAIQSTIRCAADVFTRTSLAIVSERSKGR